MTITASLRVTLLCIAVTACSAEVEVIESHPTSSGAGAGGGVSPSGGSPSTGGAGMGGGVEGAGGAGGPPPVIGCESLVQDEPFVIPEAQRGWIAGINANEMGFVGLYQSVTPGHWETRSRRLAYGSWPPAMTSEIVHDGTYGPDKSPLVVRANGDFAFGLSGVGYHFGSFYEPSPLVQVDDYAYEPIFLEPPPGSGYFAQEFYYPELQATHADTILDFGVEEVALYGTNGSGDVIALTPKELFLIQGGEAKVVGPIPSSASARPFGIVPRPGGFWIGMSPSSGGQTPVEVIAVNDDGSASSPLRLLGDATYYWLARMAAWRGGVAVVAVSSAEQAFQSKLVLTDGQGATAVVLPEVVAGCDYGPMVVVPPDGSSVIVGFVPCDASGYFELVRFRCAPG